MNSNKNLFLLSILLTFGLVTQSKCQDYSQLVPNEYKLNTIVIDAGHGGHDLGVVGGRLKEKEINLQVALRLQSALNNVLPNTRVIQTRTSDQFMSLIDRKNLARQMNADLFISIHCSAGNSSDYGATILYPGLHFRESVAKEAMRENNSILLEDNYYTNYKGFDPSESRSYTQYAFPVQSRIQQSKQLADYLSSTFRNNQRVGSLNQAGLVILNHNEFPSVFVQVGNLKNRNEENLFSSRGIESTVSLLVQGIQSYKSFIDTQANNALRSKEDDIARIEAKRKRDLAAEKRKKEAEKEAERLAEIERKRREEENWAWPSMRKLNLNGTKYFVQLTTDKEYSRTDFPFENIVMSYIEVADQYKYLVGPFDSKEKAEIVHKTAQEEEYRSAFLLTFKNGKIVR